MAKKITFKEHTGEDLAKFVSDKRDALRLSRFNASGSKNHNVKEARGIRKDIARALTEANARKIAAAAK